ncbi:hypothetical protein Tco_0319882 [Tanacetum coccineum]
MISLFNNVQEAWVKDEETCEPYDYSSSSSFDSEFEVEDISSNKAEVTEKANNAKIVNAKKDTEDQIAEEQAAKEQPRNEELGVDQGDNDLIGDTQVDVQMTEAQPDKHEATLIILRLLITRLEKKVHAMSSFNLPEAIDKSVKAHLKNVLLPNDVPYYINSNKEATKSMPKNSSTLVDQAALDEFEEKD